MKKARTKTAQMEDNGTRAEYDFAGGVRGKHARAMQARYTITIHQADGTTVTKEVRPLDKAAFEQAKRFIFADVEREIQLARATRANKSALRSLGITPGGGNFLAALGLLCYTEFGGKLKYHRKLRNGRDDAPANFNRFFDDLGAEYKAFRAAGHDVYDIFRCGLAHEFYVKDTCNICMISGEEAVGIGIGRDGRYWFVVEKYYQDLRQAFDALEAYLFPSAPSPP
jgi:hypothetical protein